MAITYTLYNRKGLMIIGDLHKPEQNIKGTCILQHGWGGTRKHATIQAMVRAFIENSIQVFVFDTTNSFGESDGDFEQSTLGLHTEDLFDVVDWVLSQDWFIGPLWLSGHSKGGYAVCRYAAAHPHSIDGVVALAPVV
ncbi:MAG: alpha/beta hydrolase [Candidatus Pacebacteria bacterium]|nr:alpha/beta hydrolase [Candidatus Paceibacterota bacterium]